MLNGHNAERARDALHSIPPDCDRGTWVKAGMAAHAAGLTFDDFDTWSAGADNYEARACRDTWRSFKAMPNGVSAGALFGMARDHGWQDNSDRPAQATPTKAAKRPAEPRPKPASTVNASLVWERCTPVKSHPYGTAKRASIEALQGLRVVPANDPLRIMGESMAGALVVPAYAPDGTLQSLQLIPPQDKKMNLPGSPMAGASFTVGAIKPGEPTYIVEGIGAGWSAWQATGCAAVVTFGWGNMTRVAAAMRQQDPTDRLVLCPDVGKESAAETIAAEFDCLVAPMPEGWPQNSDINDLFCSPDGGFDAVQALLESASAPPKPEPKVHPLARFVDLDGTAKPPRWVIPGFIGHGVTVIAGAHGVGKTTALLPLAMTCCRAIGGTLFMWQRTLNKANASWPGLCSIAIWALISLLYASACILWKL